MSKQNHSVKPTSSIEAIPPHNLEAERCLLGNLLLTPELITPASRQLTPEDFYHFSHEEIFSAMLKLNEEGAPVDAVILANRLSDLGKLEEIGGMEYLQELLDLAPMAGNWEYYATIIQVLASRRRLQKAGLVIAEMALNREGAIEDILQKADELISGAGLKENRESEITLKDLTDRTFSEFCEVQDGKKLFEGIRSGFFKLDSFTGGFQPKNLIVFAARPSMGKSSLLFQIAIACGKRGLPVLVFTAEMSKEEVGWYALCNEAEIDLQQVKRGYSKDHPKREEDNKKALDAANRLTLDNLLIVEKPSIGLAEIKTTARKWARHNPGGLIVIDHLQIIHRPRKENSNLEIGFITQELKQLSRELKIPILLASQLSRECERRDDKRPVLSDLRDSGEVEQNADLVIFIYRDDYYNPGSGAPVELIIAKNRNGEVGTLQLSFIKQYRKFTEFPRSE